MIPFLLAMLRFFRLVFEVYKKPESRGLLAAVAILLSLGTFFYQSIEGWSYLDSLYFCVISLATVGYGDFSPKTGLGKVFTMIFIMIGMGLFVGFVNVIVTTSLDQKRRKSR
ncbi:MAG: potassium channel family protein [Oligoflexus sp.]